jgi:hypothetical protein
MLVRTVPRECQDEPVLADHQLSATRRLLIERGLATLGDIAAVPKSLTLREAPEAENVSAESLVAALRDFFESRLARSARRA